MDSGVLLSLRVDDGLKAMAGVLATNEKVGIWT